MTQASPARRTKIVAKKLAKSTKAKPPVNDLAPEVINTWIAEGAESYRTGMLNYFTEHAPGIHEDVIKALLIGYDYAIGNDFVNSMIQGVQSSDHVDADYVLEFVNSYGTLHEDKLTEHLENLEDIANRMAEEGQPGTADFKVIDQPVTTDERIAFGSYMLLNPDLFPALLEIFKTLVPSLKTEIVETILHNASKNMADVEVTPQADDSSVQTSDVVLS